MTNTKVSRRSSSRWDTLLKTDFPRAVDDWINYFGDWPSTKKAAEALDLLKK